MSVKRVGARDTRTGTYTMDVRSLRYFVETVRLQSFTQAAEVLHVTQSTISKMVHVLEEEAGGPLLVREGRRFVLTDLGAIVYARGQEMLALSDRLRREIDDIRTKRQGTLTIGIPPMINVLFTPVLKEFRRRYPDIVLNLCEGTAGTISREVAAGTLEIGITILPAEPGLAFETVEIARYPICAMARAGTFLPDRTTIRLEQLKELPLVLLRSDFALTIRLLKKFAAAGIEPRIAAQSAQWDWVVSMASCGLGVALLPEPFAQRLCVDNLQTLRVSDPDVEWPIAQIWNGNHLSHAARAWLEVSQNVFGANFGRWPEVTEKIVGPVSPVAVLGEHVAPPAMGETLAGRPRLPAC